MIWKHFWYVYKLFILPHCGFLGLKLGWDDILKNGPLISRDHKSKHCWWCGREINPNCVYDKEQPAKLCNLGRTDEWRLVANEQLRRLFVVGWGGEEVERSRQSVVRDWTRWMGFTCPFKLSCVLSFLRSVMDWTSSRRGFR